MTLRDSLRDSKQKQLGLFDQYPYSLNIQNQIFYYLSASGPQEIQGFWT